MAAVISSLIVIIIFIFIYYNRLSKIVGKVGTALIMCVPIMFVIILVFMSIYRYRYDDSHEFTLDTENKYILYDNDVTTDRELFYEVDFDSNEITYRENTDKHKRENNGKVNKDNYKEISNIIQQTINNDSNKTELTDEEINAFYRNNVYDLYIIKDYNGNLYYIKDIETTKRLKDLLSQVKRNALFF